MAARCADASSRPLHDLVVRRGHGTRCGRERIPTGRESAIRARFVRDSFHSLSTDPATGLSRRIVGHFIRETGMSPESLMRGPGAPVIGGSGAEISGRHAASSARGHASRRRMRGSMRRAVHAPRSPEPKRRGASAPRFHCPIARSIVTVWRCQTPSRFVARGSNREAGRDAAVPAGIAVARRRHLLAGMANDWLEWTFAGHGGSRYLSVRRNARAAQALLERRRRQ